MALGPSLRQEGIKALAGISMTTEIVLSSPCPQYWEVSYSRLPIICMEKVNMSELASRPMRERDQKVNATTEPLNEGELWYS